MQKVIEKYCKDNILFDNETAKKHPKMHLKKTVLTDILTFLKWKTTQTNESQMFMPFWVWPRQDSNL